jgi:hypothetical protein
MQRYKRCKAKDPHNTSACFLVPSTKGPWNKYRPSLTVLAKYPKGATLHKDPRSDQPISSPFAMLALYNKPTPTMRLNAFSDNAQPLHMLFPGSLAGQNVNVLIDTGASHSFLDVTFSKKHGFHIKPDTGSVNCGGNTVATVSGSATLPLVVYPDLRQHVKFYLTKLPHGHSVILGNTWLLPNKVILDHNHRTMEAAVHGKSFEFA